MTYSFFGFGTAFVGRQANVPVDRTITKWVTAMFIPLVPLATYRVLAEERNAGGIPLLIYHLRTFYVVERVRLDWQHVLRIYAGVVPLLTVGAWAMSKAASN